MEIGADEMMDVPLLRDADQYKSKWSSSRSRRPAKKVEKTLEQQYLDDVEIKKYVLVAGSIVAAGLAIYSTTLR